MSRTLTIDVPEEIYDRLAAAGEKMNGQRPTQVAALLLNEQNVIALERKWEQAFGVVSSTNGAERVLPPPPS